MEGQETEPAVTLRRSAQSNGHSAMDSTSNGTEGCHGERRPCSTPALNLHGRHRNGPDGRGRPRSVNIERKKYSKIQENGGYHPENGELANIIDSRHLTISLDNFHINELQNNGQCVNESDVYFAGRRDVFRPDSLVESKIVSHKGTCRGFKNRVRAGINTFRLQEGVLESPTQKNYCVSEQGKIVVYSTSVAVIRDTHERCKVVKNILQNHMVRFEERDLCMSLDNQRELMLRLHDPRPTLPQVFVDGRALGSLEEVVLLNETGELRTILKNFPKVKLATSCESCGGYRFIPCTVCHGSKKSIHRNNFTEEFCALRCMHCDEHGLVRCPLCLDQQE